MCANKGWVRDYPIELNFGQQSIWCSMFPTETWFLISCQSARWFYFPTFLLTCKMHLTDLESTSPHTYQNHDHKNTVFSMFIDWCLCRGGRGHSIDRAACAWAASRTPAADQHQHPARTQGYGRRERGYRFVFLSFYSRRHWKAVKSQYFGSFSEPKVNSSNSLG